MRTARPFGAAASAALIVALLSACSGGGAGGTAGAPATGSNAESTVASATTAADGATTDGDSLDSSIPTSDELCGMLSPAQIDAALAWSGFTVDPSKMLPGERDHPLCDIGPSNVDFNADVSNLTLEAFPVDCDFGEGSTRDELPASWAVDLPNYEETNIAGHTVHVIDGLSLWVFLPDYTLQLNGYGTANLPEYTASLESLMAELLAS